VDEKGGKIRTGEEKSARTRLAARGGCSQVPLYFPIMCSAQFLACSQN
jgi:hypothetical protein